MTITQKPQEWTLDGFVRHFEFVHYKMPDHKFVWVLGAGASFSSGIPLGSELVDEWLEEIYQRDPAEDKPDLEKWATAERLEIEGFKYEDRHSVYTEIYQRRFREYPDEGYAYLESAMSGKDPSPGYSILAYALAANPPRHNAVITTNFDNLVADALAIYTDTFPFVCGHESLTGFVRVAMRRPLVCKIHRDLVLAPQNDPRSLKRMNDSWGTALRALFEHYTPLFIGYGGNDDTLMDLLGSLAPGDIKGQLVWCYYEGSKPSDTVLKVVRQHKGVLVPVPDFDLLMVRLGEKMRIPLLDKEINVRATKRIERYAARILKLSNAAADGDLTATLQRSGRWWAVEHRARMAKEVAAIEAEYKNGIQEFPDSADLRQLYAAFLESQEQIERADALYQEAIKLEPANGKITGLYAAFLERQGDAELQKAHEKGDESCERAHKYYEKAHEFYETAVKLDPLNADNKASFASFMHTVRENPPEAERLFREALKLEPNRTELLIRFAEFLNSARHRSDEVVQLYRRVVRRSPREFRALFGLATLYMSRGSDEADVYYKTAIEIDPSNAALLGDYAIFLATRPERRTEAEGFYRDAVKKDPFNANNMANFAGFLWQQKGDTEEAERLYRRSFALKPDDCFHLLNYGDLLAAKGDHVRADSAFQRALNCEPGNADCHARYADYLRTTRTADKETAVKYYRQAVELDPNNAPLTLHFANFLTDEADRREEAEPLYLRALELAPGDELTNACYAEFLLEAERLDDAEFMLARARGLNADTPNAIAAAVALNTGILACVRGESDADAVADVTRLLHAGFERGPWIFDGVLAVLRRHCSEADVAFYTALVDGIRDENRVPDLDALAKTRAAASNGAKRRRPSATLPVASAPKQTDKDASPSGNAGGNP